MFTLFDELKRRRDDNLQDGENADKDFVKKYILKILINKLD